MSEEDRDMSEKVNLKNTPCPITKEKGCLGEECGHWGFHLPTPKCGLSGIGSACMVGSVTIARSISDPEKYVGTETEAMTGVKGELSLAGMLDAVGRDIKESNEKVARAIEYAGIDVKEGLRSDTKQTVYHKKDKPVEVEEDPDSEGFESV
jgi:hypothetical protein